MTAQRPVLSISIPTFNRSGYVEAAVRRVAAQVAELDLPAGTVEIVITNNASTDGTEQTVQQLMSEFDGIRYFRNDSNLGIDGNIHRAVENATGQFVHLLSDDDKCEPHLYRDIFAILARTPDLHFMFLNAFVLDRNGEDRRPPVLKVNSEALEYLDKEQLLLAVGEWITFLSSFVVRRDSWVAAVEHKRYIGTEIYLSYVALSLLAQNDGGYVYRRPCIGVHPQFTGSYRIYRAFAEQWRKLLLDFAPAHGYSRATMRSIFGKSILTNLCGRVMDSRRGGVLSSNEVKLLIKSTWDFPQAWTSLFPRMVMPLSVFDLLKKALR